MQSLLVRSTYKLMRFAWSMHEKVRLAFTVKRKTMKGTSSNVQYWGLGVATGMDQVWATKKRTLAITLKCILNWQGKSSEKALQAVFIRYFFPERRS